MLIYWRVYLLAKFTNHHSEPGIWGGGWRSSRIKQGTCHFEDSSWDTSRGCRKSMMGIMHVDKNIYTIWLFNDS